MTVSSTTRASFIGWHVSPFIQLRSFADKGTQAVDYGIPAAGVLCIELLYAVRRPHAADMLTMSRTDTVQSLMTFVTLLDWVRAGDGNYELCRKLKVAIRNVLDRVLDAPVVAAHPQRSETYVSEPSDPEIDPFGPDANIGETDWLSLLNSMDWTQGGLDWR